MEAADVLSDRSPVAVQQRAGQRRAAMPLAEIGWLERARNGAQCVGPVLLADVLALATAWVIAGLVSTGSWPSLSGSWLSLAVAFLIATLMCHAAVGLYPGVGLSLIAETRRATVSAAYLGGAFLLVGWSADRLTTSAIVLLACCLLAGLVPIGRALARGFASRFAW